MCDETLWEDRRHHRHDRRARWLPHRLADRSLSQAETPIADCAEPPAGVSREHGTGHGTQPGDPARAAAALIDVAESCKPPCLLVLGNDASNGLCIALDSLRADLDGWEDVSRSTDFSD